MPCGVLAMVHGGETRFASAGLPCEISCGPECALFDLASLSKVVSTTALAMLLVDDGDLDLDAPICNYLPDFLEFDLEHEAWRRRLTTRMLLAHCGGLPAGLPFWKSGVTRTEEKRGLVRRTALSGEPGGGALYSDIGMMLVGQIIERITGEALDVSARRRVFIPLGMERTCYNPADVSVCVPTEEKAEEPGVFWRGIVHDENARWLGGVAGHAGVFSCAEDLARMCSMLLRGGDGFVSGGTFRTFTRKAGLVEGSSRCLGWDGYSAGCAGGDKASPDSFGHTGFTGTSLWIDIDNDVAVVLLTNAVHPHRECKSHGYFRVRNEIHTSCYE
ncbi:MAG: beta-lactamase family protein [Victivallales bacterium]|nr:beta-lactamase family protein [Victivallales bacterium]